jgi:hypothetical protein
MDNDVGFDVDSAPSAIIHNVSRSNTTNYDIFVGNMLGTIATSAATMNSSANTNINLSY